mmetsp:Transcript_24194/g.67083  ORF Transcript_24194/g.67083 Transcript_24194/m.67083 type:complete len:220 (-) Transcript_24194:528-1187(-)
MYRVGGRNDWRRLSHGASFGTNVQHSESPRLCRFVSCRRLVAHTRQNDWGNARGQTVGWCESFGTLAAAGQTQCESSSPTARIVCGICRVREPMVRSGDKMEQLQALARQWRRTRKQPDGTQWNLCTRPGRRRECDLFALQLGIRPRREVRCERAISPGGRGSAPQTTNLSGNLCPTHDAKRSQLSVLRSSRDARLWPHVDAMVRQCFGNCVYYHYMNE